MMRQLLCHIMDWKNAVGPRKSCSSSKEEKTYCSSTIKVKKFLKIKKSLSKFQKTSSRTKDSSWSTSGISLKQLSMILKPKKTCSVLFNHMQHHKKRQFSQYIGSQVLAAVVPLSSQFLSETICQTAHKTLFKSLMLSFDNKPRFDKNK